jgi:hypothetical protein
MTYAKYIKLSTLFRVLLIIGLIFVELFLSTLWVAQVIIPWISSFDEASMLGAFNFGMIYSVLLIAACTGIDYVVLGLYRKHVEKKEFKLLNKELGRI